MRYIPNIGQYADDTALLAKCFADWKRMAAHLRTWCDATAMKENMTKREGMLLAKLNRERERAPKGNYHTERRVGGGRNVDTRLRSTDG